MTEDKIYKIGIVEDDRMFGEMLLWYFKDIDKYDAKLYPTAEDLLDDRYFEADILILDYHLNSEKPDAMNGMELAKIKKDIPKIILSAQEEIPVALEMLKYKGCDYIEKGKFDIEKARESVDAIVEQLKLNEEIEVSRNNNKKSMFRLGFTISIIVIIILAIISSH